MISMTSLTVWCSLQMLTFGVITWRTVRSSNCSLLTDDPHDVAFGEDTPRSCGRHW